MSRMLLWPVSASFSYKVSRMVTFSGAANVIPRSWHSVTSYFNCNPTGSPHLLQKVTTFLLNVPHFVQRTSPTLNGLVMTVCPQCLHVLRRWCRPLRFPHLHSQFPIE